MSDASGVAEAMLGLDGFRVLAVDETAAEVVIQIETSGAGRLSEVRRRGHRT